MSFSDLKSTVMAEVNKPEIIQNLNRFIARVEAKVNRKLRVRQMICRASRTISNEFEAVPDDFMGPRSFELDSTPNYELQYLAPDQLGVMKPAYQAAGKPLYYSIIGGEFQFLPAPGEDYTASLNYWQGVPALSDSNTTNWLLDAHPDAYLEGVKAEAYKFLGSAQMAALHTAAFEDILSDIEADDRSQSYGQGLQAIPSLVV